MRGGPPIVAINTAGLQNSPDSIRSNIVPTAASGAPARDGESAMASVRPPAVAGTFYPGDAGALDAAVRGYLAAATAGGAPPKAVIAPHAGYVYSGAVAAEAYARLAAARDAITRVVLVGPAHRMPFRGIAASGAEAFATPLGAVPVDARATARLMPLPHVVVLNEAHRLEHSLEVQLPFLQRMLGDFRVVPLVVGDATGKQVAEALALLWGGPETLIIVSSDLSHYLGYDAAKTMDAETCNAIEELRPDDIAHEQACGRIPIEGLLAIARDRGMAVATVGLCNSGDTAGPRDKVVGYGAWVFREAAGAPGRAEDTDSRAAAPKSSASPRTAAGAERILARHGGALLRVALTSIVYGLKDGAGLKANPAKYPATLGETLASFVTLTLDGALRGCIGSPTAVKPLVTDVADNAYAAAFKDPRFKPLAEAELESLDIDISLLSDPEPMTFANQADLLAQLRPGADGLIISQGKHRALFLPSVWEAAPKPADFLAHLKVKAGLAADHWSPDLTAARFTTASTSFSGLGHLD